MHGVPVLSLVLAIAPPQIYQDMLQPIPNTWTNTEPKYQKIPTFHLSFLPFSSSASRGIPPLQNAWWRHSFQDPTTLPYARYTLHVTMNRLVTQLQCAAKYCRVSRADGRRVLFSTVSKTPYCHFADRSHNLCRDHRIVLLEHCEPGALQEHEAISIWPYIHTTYMV